MRFLLLEHFGHWTYMLIRTLPFMFICHAIFRFIIRDNRLRNFRIACKPQNVFFWRLILMEFRVFFMHRATHDNISPFLLDLSLFFTVLFFPQNADNVEWIQRSWAQINSASVITVSFTFYCSTYAKEDVTLMVLKSMMEEIIHLWFFVHVQKFRQF